MAKYRYSSNWFIGECRLCGKGSGPFKKVERKDADDNWQTLDCLCNECHDNKPDQRLEKPKK